MLINPGGCENLGKTEGTWNIVKLYQTRALTGHKSAVARRCHQVRVGWVQHNGRLLVRYLAQLLERLVDKDDGDEGGEALLREAGDVPYQGAQVQGHDQQQDTRGPDADPKAERKELPLVVSEKGYQNALS